MITTFYPPYSFGGDGIFVQRLTTELARRGHHVEVIHCRDSHRLRHRRDPAARYADHPGVLVHGLDSALGPLSPLATQQTGLPIGKASKIRRILESGFDVIHYHNISLVGGPGVLRLGKGIKLFTLHEYWLVCPTHVLFRYNRAPCVRPHCLLCTLTYRRPPQWWRKSGLLESGLACVDALIAPSRFSRDVHSRLPFAKRIVHIPHFVPEDEGVDSGARPLELELETPPYFLFAGRLEKLKGLQTLIPLFRRWGKASLWIAGRGAYESRLRSLAEGSPLIRFLGHQNPPRLRTLFRDAVALIVPSINYEVFPLVILEAFSQRTPAVARNLGSLPEAILESGAGFVYADDDELLAALERLLADRAHRDELGARGYAAYHRNWSPDAHLARYYGLIDELAATRQAGRV